MAAVPKKNLTFEDSSDSFFTPDEVATHCSPEDCWISFLGRVFNVTPLIKAHAGELTRPILKMAGKDVSHWFDADTGDVRRHVDPISQIYCYYAPSGRFVHIPPAFPCSSWRTDIGLPWWFNPEYCIGRLSRKVRKVIIVNVLTGAEDTLEVCAEETISSIRNRYLTINSHAMSYTWKRLGVPLVMDKTLEDNGIPDETEEFYTLNLDDDYYIPRIHVYFDDDLTVA